MVDRNVGENFSKEIVDAIHDLTVAIKCCLPNAVIDNVTSMINKIDLWMLSADLSESVFDGFPRGVAELDKKFIQPLYERIIHSNLLCNLPIFLLHLPGSLRLHHCVDSRRD